MKATNIVGLAFTAAALATSAVPAVAAPAQSLDSTEKELIRRVDRSYPEQLALLERIVNQNSETMNFDGVAAVAAPFLDGLKALGFETRWQDLRATANRAGHVIAVRHGHTGKRLLLIGHLDTVHPRTSPFNRFVRDGDRARGPGTDDMKNGDAVILYALKALNAGGLLKDRDITVILTGDEEMTTEDTALTRGAMISAARAADAVLSFESGEPGVVVTSRRGYTSWRLEVTGKQAHSGSIFTPAVGAGAIFETARILNAFHDQVLGDPKLTFNAGTIVGGTEAAFDSGSNSGTVFGKENVVPKITIVAGEIRAVSVAQDARTRANMEAIVAAHLPGTGAQIRFHDEFSPMEEKPGNLALQRLYSDINVALGQGPARPNDPVTRGAGDISFVANIVPQALDGLGGAGEGAHSTDEWVDLTSFRIATQRAAILIARLTAAR